MQDAGSTAPHAEGRRGLDAAPHDARDDRHRQQPVARVRGHRGAHRRVERAGVRRRHPIAREPVLRVERRDVVVDRLRERLRRLRHPALDGQISARGQLVDEIERLEVPVGRETAEEPGDRIGPRRRTFAALGEDQPPRRHPRRQSAHQGRPVEPVKALSGQGGRERPGQRHVLDGADDPGHVARVAAGQVRAEFESTYGVSGFNLSAYDQASLDVTGTFAPDGAGASIATGRMAVMGLTLADCSNEPGSACEGTQSQEVGSADWQ